VVVIFFKNLCLLVISLTLVSCYEDNDCSDSSSSTVDIYLSFDVDFEGADTLIYNDNEYIGGCESELLTTQKTNASYQPKMQGIRIEQHNNGAKHSARFDSEYSRIDFFTSDFIKFLTPHTFYFWLKPIREGHLAKIGTNNISIVDNKIKIDWGNGVKSLSADIDYSRIFRVKSSTVLVTIIMLFYANTLHFRLITCICFLCC
jgi:hypothetical protein